MTESCSPKIRESTATIWTPATSGIKKSRVTISFYRKLAGFSRRERLFLLPIFLIPLSSTSCPKGIPESHTTSEAVADEPSQLSPGVSTRRHVAQVKKKKKNERERNGRREAKSYPRTRSCVDSCVCIYVFINVLVPFHRMSSDAFDVDARRSMTRIGMRFHKLISWDYLRWSASSLSVSGNKRTGFPYGCNYICVTDFYLSALITFRSTLFDYKKIYNYFQIIQIWYNKNI